MTDKQDIEAALRCAIGTHGDACIAAGECVAITKCKDALDALERMGQDSARLRERPAGAIGHGATANDSDALLLARVRSMREALELWNGIGFDFWITDDEWAGREPDHDDEREWVNLSDLTRSALAIDAARAQEKENADAAE